MTIKLPATIGLQVDGSAVDLNDCLDEEDLETLKQAEDKAQVMITYRFDVLAQVLSVAIPRTYDNALFSQKPQAATQPTTMDAPEETAQRMTPERVNEIVAQGKQVTVQGATPNPEKRNAYIIAGTTRKASTGDIKPVALRVTAETHLYKRTGEQVQADAIATLKSGDMLLVEGKENKHGVIQAVSILF